MPEEKQCRDERASSLALIELYDALGDFTDFCFSYCNALDGMLSKAAVLEQKTVNGVQISTNFMKHRIRATTERLRGLCETVRGRY